MLFYKQFITSLRWNTLESLLYHGMLLGHQLALFHHTSLESYGIIGTLFALIYSSITVVSIGLDSSLSSFFLQCAQSRAHVRRIFIPQFLFTLACLGLAAAVIIIGLPLLGSPKLSLTTTTLVIVGLLIVMEGVKKIARMLLQLAFLNHITASVELITIGLYVSSVWLWYFHTGNLSPEVVFVPMLITSWLSTCTLAYFCYRWYQTLPHTTEQSPHKAQGKHIITTRLYTYGIQISHLVFSSNMLVPLFALKFGLASAALIKLISSVTYTITTILHKIFGPTTHAYLSNVKTSDLAIKRKVFATTTRIVYPLLYGMIFFVLFNHKTLIALTCPQATHAAPLIVMCILMHLSEHFFIAYEAFYVIEGKSLYLFMVTLATIITGYSALHLAVTPLATFSYLLAIRITSFIIISIIAWRIWKIYPSYSIPKRAIIGFGALSLFLLSLSSYIATK